MSTTGNASNNKSQELTNSLQTLDNKKVDFPAQCGIIKTVEGMNPASLERTHNMTDIFLATAADMTLAFSNIGSALTFIEDSHAALNPEGSTLMLSKNHIFCSASVGGFVALSKK